MLCNAFGKNICKFNFSFLKFFLKKKYILKKIKEKITIKLLYKIIIKLLYMHTDSFLLPLIYDFLTL
jgi:hypothetical protein